MERILEKDLQSFPCLALFGVELTVEFYNAFHSFLYLLPVTPFDCISNKMGYKALCLPGLGLPCYAMIAWILMELFPRLLLLPRADAQVNLLVNIVRMDLDNGYDLTWHLLALPVPGFDPSYPVKLPSWNDEDIFNFALLFILFFWLQAKKGVVQHDCTRSTRFLNSINKPMYANAIMTLQLCITNYTPTLDDEYVPSHLCLMGLANQINTNAHTRIHTVILRIRKTLGMEVDMSCPVPIQGSLFAACRPRLWVTLIRQPPLGAGRLCQQPQGCTMRVLCISG